MPGHPLLIPLFPPLLWIWGATALTYVFREPFSPKTAGWAGGYQPPGHVPHYPRYGEPGYVSPNLPARPCPPAKPARKKRRTKRTSRKG